jgi:hypothetical protein
MGTMASHLYLNPENPNELIDSPWGKVPAWKASTLATGTMGAYSEYIKQVRADATLAHDALNVREQAVTARQDAVTAREQAVVDLLGRASLLFDRLDKRLSEAEARRDQAQEEPLPHPPGPGDEGDLETPKSAKDPEDYDLERDLRDPDNQDLTLADMIADPIADQGTETPFSIPGDPDLPEPLPRDPGGD